MITSNQAITDVDNPDTEAVESKSELNISYNSLEVSASGYSSSVQFNGNDINILNDITIPSGSNRYYTPLFKENLSYTVWKTTVNKTFSQLSNI